MALITQSDSAALISPSRGVFAAATLAELKTFTVPLANQTVEVDGSVSRGDGLAGTYYWNATDSRADNGTTIIQSNAGGVGRWNLVAATALDSTFTPSGAGAVARSVQSKERDWVSVKDFGAIGNGVTDDTAAIQAALNAFLNIGGTAARACIVLLPNGYYQITSALSVPSNVHFLGMGLGSQINQKGAAANGLFLNATANTIVSDMYITSESNIDNGVNTSSGSGLVAMSCTTPTIRNVWTAVFGTSGFIFDGCTEARVLHCVGDQSAGDGFQIKNFAGNSSFVDCISDAYAGYGFNISFGSSYNFKITGCTGGSSKVGSKAVFRCNGSQGIRFTDCLAANANQEGYLVGDSTQCLDVTFTGCIAMANSASASNTYDGFSIQNARRTRLVNSSAYGGGHRYGWSTTGSSRNTEIVAGHFEGVTAPYLHNQSVGNMRYLSDDLETTTSGAVTANIPLTGLNNFSAQLIRCSVVANQRNLVQFGAFVFVTTVVTDGTSTRIANGPTSLYSFISTAGLAATLVITSAAANAGTCAIQVTGIAGNTIDWKASVEILSMTQ